MAKEPTYPENKQDYAPWVAIYGLLEPYGKCQCGCGQDAPVSVTNKVDVGRKKGQLSRFCHGHNAVVPHHERFKENIKVAESGCWEWQAAKTQAGYGVFLVSRKNVYTHRYSYELHNGPIPEGMHVCHKCDNPRCCNPDHLFLGDDAVNIKDMWDKGRGFVPPPAKGKDNINAKLTEGNVREIRRRSALGEKGVNLAREFGVRTTTISAIVNRQSWVHLT